MAGKLKVMHEMNKQVKTINQIAKKKRIPLSTHLEYLKNCKSVEKQAVNGKLN
jgi:hypothetical protein